MDSLQQLRYIHFSRNWHVTYTTYTVIYPYLFQNWPLDSPGKDLVQPLLHSTVQLCSTTFNTDHKRKRGEFDKLWSTCSLNTIHFQRITTNVVLCGSNLIPESFVKYTQRVIAFHVVGPWLRPRYSSRFMRSRRRGCDRLLNTIGILLGI